MAMAASEIEALIKAALPGADVQHTAAARRDGAQRAAEAMARVGFAEEP